MCGLKAGSLETISQLLHINRGLALMLNNNVDWVRETMVR